MTKFLEAVTAKLQSMKFQTSLLRFQYKLEY